MNSARLFKNVKVIYRAFHPRYFASFPSVRQNLQCYLSTSLRINRSSHLNAPLKSVKGISNFSSMQTDSDSSNEKKNVKMQKILEDEEFQNILKDFANDFGVDSETNELLDDIRKNIDQEYKKNKISEEQCSTSTSSKASSVLGAGLDHKYKEFSDADAIVIPSYEDEVFEDERIYHIDQELEPKLPYADLKRGITGVFDIHELIQVLRNESLLDITTISVPEDLHYTDFLVLATAKSKRHSEAIVESIKKIYKMKKNKKDPFVLVEGDNVSTWKVMDMGNIVLHIFLEDTRALYDIESLWLLDSKYDTGGNEPVDPMLDMMEEQLAFFNNLEQSNSQEMPKDSI